MACPGCDVILDARAWLTHVPNCARVPGVNASSRHRDLKDAIKQLLHEAALPFDTAEPRELQMCTCPGCAAEIVASDFKSHVEACPRVSIADRVKEVRASGPDIRCYIAPDGVNSSAIDVTVVAAEAPSNLSASHLALFSAVRARKIAKYGASCAARNEALVVAAWTETGMPSTEARNLVDGIANLGGMCVFASRKRVANAVILGTGVRARE